VVLTVILVVMSRLGMSAQTAAPVVGGVSTTVPVAISAWILGIARFDPAKAGDQITILQETLPRLIASNLVSLPKRQTPDSIVAETAVLMALRERFTAGIDLASRLDARSARFFDPSLDKNARRSALVSAEKEIAVSAQKLADLDTVKDIVVSPRIDRPAKLWTGNLEGRLIDITTSSLAQAAKAADVDLLVTGTIGIRSGYAIVSVRGFDATFQREAFVWKTFCAVDDPAPLAAEIAKRLELWVAGRAFARLEWKLNPASAELSVNGELHEVSSRVFYAYTDTNAHLEATASGYKTRTIDIGLALGDRKSLEVALEPTTTGAVKLTTDPQGAAITLDSVPIGRTPISITLDGGRGIVTASEKGRETQSIVLPGSGETNLNISLLPSDGLGPSGRISAAKDRFYQSLGWFVISIPATTLTADVFRGYDEAYVRSGASTIYVSRNYAVAALSASAIATAVTATIAVVRLVKYLVTAH
jgi:hypothetical protein